MSNQYDYGNTIAKAASRSRGDRLNDLYFLCEGQKSVSTKKLERMIDKLADSDRLDGIHFRELADKISSDIRAPMAGHVLVPVEPTEAMIEAGCKQHECQQQDTWYSNSELSEYDCEAIYKAMLNASKGE